MSSVKELYEQAHKLIETPLDENIYGPNAFRRYKIFDYDKFAELIVNQVVKDCAKIAWNNEPDGVISNMILDRFGVKDEIKMDN